MLVLVLLFLGLSVARMSPCTLLQPTTQPVDGRCRYLCKMGYSKTKKIMREVWARLEAGPRGGFCRDVVPFKVVATGKVPAAECVLANRAEDLGAGEVPRVNEEKKCAYHCFKHGEVFNVRKHLAGRLDKGVFTCPVFKSMEEVNLEMMEGMMPWKYFQSFNQFSREKFLRTMGVFASYAYRTIKGNQVQSFFDGKYLKYSPFVMPEGFQVVGLLQSRASTGKAKRQGFVAVGPGRRMVISWRGTLTEAEWVDNAKALLEPVSGVCPGGKVHSGFYNMLKRTSVVYAVEKGRHEHRIDKPRFVHIMHKPFVKAMSYLTRRHRTDTVFNTGHSLGGALAVLSTYELVRAKVVKPFRTNLVTFGAPRVGNGKFATCFNKLGLFAQLRVVSPFDPVPALPPAISGYKHIRGKFVPKALATVKAEDKRLEYGCAHSMSSYISFFSDDVAGHRAKDVICGTQKDHWLRSLGKKVNVWFYNTKASLLGKEGVSK